MIMLTCPNCSAHLDVDENREFAFCQYCGTKLVNLTQKIELTNPVTVDRTQELDGLIVRAMEFEAKQDYQRALEYCNRILDLDPSNTIARAMEQRLPGYSIGPNVTIVYRSYLNDSYKLRITMDGKNWTVLNNGQSMSLSLAEGRHSIRFSGTKTYTYDVRIINPLQKINIIYTAERRKNKIEQF